MRKLTVSLLAVVVLSMTCAAVDAAEKGIRTTGVKGILINEKTNTPFKGILVQLLKVDKIEDENVYFSGNTISSKTDNSGVFIFENVKPGKYLLDLYSGIISAAPGSYESGAINKVIEISENNFLDLGTTLRTK